MTAINIPNKSDGDVWYAANLFKVLAWDNVAVSAGTATETTLSTVNLSANVASSMLLIAAGCRGLHTSPSGNGAPQDDFTIKIDGVTRKVYSLHTYEYSTVLGQSSVGVVGYLEKDINFGTSHAITITGKSNTIEPGVGTQVDWVIIVGV